MFIITYQHPLHGIQTLSCHTLIKLNGEFHVKNIHGATYQVIDANRIVSITPKEEEGVS